jgi:pyridoxal phosphate enzyme (YggS family)
MSSLAERLAGIEARIAAAAASACRSRDDIELIVVSKNHPAQMAVELIHLGVRALGENRDQEAKPKSVEVAQALEGSNFDFQWHFIGQLQSNKVRSALSYASVVHSVDRQSLLDALIKAAAERTEELEIFIQLNLTQDPGRGGIEPKNVLAFADQVLAAPGLKLLGVMGVASLDQQPERDFATIQESSELLKTLSAEARFISAGMSEDFEAAIGFGATHLRIGSAITGKRQY